MTCDSIQDELIGYQFATLDASTRTRVEAHLICCASCVREFVQLKRDIEQPAAGPLPSKESRTRLREEIARELAGRGRARMRRTRFWEPSFALGFAAAAMIATVGITYSINSGTGNAPHSLRR